MVVIVDELFGFLLVCLIGCYFILCFGLDLRFVCVCLRLCVVNVFVVYMFCFDVWFGYGWWGFTLITYLAGSFSIWGLIYFGCFVGLG